MHKINDGGQTRSELSLAEGSIGLKNVLQKWEGECPAFHHKKNDEACDSPPPTSSFPHPLPSHPFSFSSPAFFSSQLLCTIFSVNRRPAALNLHITDSV